MLNNENWNNVLSSNNFTDAFSYFYKTFLSLFNNCFPLKNVTINSNIKKNEWVNNDVKRSSEVVKNWYILQKHYPQLRTVYIDTKRRHNALVKKTKITFYENQIQNSGNKSKTVWSIISEINNKKATQQNNIILHVNNDIINKPPEIVHKFNSFFQQAPYEVISLLKDTDETLDFSKIPSVSESMCAFPYTESELSDIIKKLKNKNSSGLDEVPCSLLRQVSHTIITPLTHLVNLSFSEGLFPDELKISKVIPVHKRNSITDIANYRPISITSSFSKIFEYCMLSRLLSHLDKHKIICNSQHGFRENHSTMTAIDSFFKFIMNSLDKGEVAIAMFADLSRAFDCVCHHLFKAKLNRCGIRGVVADWFISYLTKRFQFVQIFFKDQRGNIINEKSSLLPIDIGVPQGSILGPILFLLFINDIVYFVNFFLALFADDTSAAISARNNEELKIKLYVLLEELERWFSLNKLYLNATKTKLMLFRPKQNNHQIELDPNLNLNNQRLTCESEIKFLGLNIDEHLTWKPHCAKLITKLNSICFQIKNLKSMVGIKTIINYYYAQVYSRLKYGICFWGLSTMAEEVFKTQKRIIRCIAGIRGQQSCRPFFIKYKILTLTSIYIMEVLVYVFNNKNSLERNNSQHNHDTRNKDHFKTPANRLEITKKSHISVGIKLYNSLPEHVKLSTNVNSFKKILTKFLSEQSLYSIEEFFKCNFM